MSRVEENDERSRTNNYEVIKELHHRIAELDGMLAEETRQLKEMTAQMEKTSLKKAIDLIKAQPPEPRYPSYYVDLLREADVPDKDVGKCSEKPNGSNLISRKEALKAVSWDTEAYMAINMLPSAEPDEKLEKCRFEYINACRIVTFPTPDTTKKDISDAYAVIKVLQPIFGDVVF